MMGSKQVAVGSGSEVVRVTCRRHPQWSEIIDYVYNLAQDYHGQPIEVLVEHRHGVDEVQVQLFGHSSPTIIERNVNVYEGIRRALNRAVRDADRGRRPADVLPGLAAAQPAQWSATAGGAMEQTPT